MGAKRRDRRNQARLNYIWCAGRAFVGAKRRDRRNQARLNYINPVAVARCAQRRTSTRSW